MRMSWRKPLPSFSQFSVPYFLEKVRSSRCNLRRRMNTNSFFSADRELQNPHCFKFEDYSIIRSDTDGQLSFLTPI